MIRWCSWCSTWLGDKPPLDDYAITHTVCERCLAETEDGTALSERGARLSAFYASLREGARSGALPSAAELYAQAGTLGIRPVELLLGLIQPALHEVGVRWQRGELSVAQQHRFSAMCDAVCTLVLESIPSAAAFCRSARPCVLIANAPGSLHSFGVRVIEVLLASEGVPNYAAHEGLSVDELVALVRRLGPDFVGLSVSMDSQLPAVAQLRAALRDSSARFVVGGFPLKMGLRVDLPGVEILPDACQFVEEVVRFRGSSRNSA